MTFERTKVGQQNRALFYDVEYIIYSEGAASDGSSAWDELFWRTLLTVFLPTTSFKILPKGSKTELKKLANRVISEDIQNTIIVCDRDFDDINDMLFVDHRIIYTFGYSWENDVWGIVSPSHVVYRHFPVKTSWNELDRIVDYQFREIRKFSRSLAAIDYICASEGAGFIPRGREQKYVAPATKAKWDGLARDQIRKALEDRKDKFSSDTFRKIRGQCREWHSLCGHFLDEFCIRAVFFLLKKLGRSSIQKDGVKGMAIAAFGGTLGTGNDDLYKYYRERIAAAFV